MIFIIVILAVAAIVLLAVGLGLPIGPFGSAGTQTNVRNMVASQRNAVRYQKERTQGRSSTNIFDAASAARVKKVADSRLTMAKKLKYAQWKISPLVYRLIQLAVSLLAFFIVRQRLNLGIQLLALTTGPVFVGWFLTRAINRRFLAFDRDYPQFLLSLVGLLKTGMNPLTALAAAAEGLEDSSMVRVEVELMLERLRLGVTEDQSIGSFGDDIYHQEIELFVQALLLSRRVGGNLSETLDRLARQVRKRQHFRQAASAAVAMQRGSIWIILGILVAIELYMYFLVPELVTGAWETEMGWQIWQSGIIIILFGMFLIRQVTKIRI